MTDGLTLEPTAQTDTSVGTDPVGNPSDVEVPGGSAELTAPVADALDVSAYGNHVVTVKVDGEELTVPLSEALNGYSRTSDYTKKTTALAAERKRLEQAERLAAALDADPHAALASLAEAVGWQPQAPVQETVDWESMTPEEQRIHELDQRVAAFETQQVQAQIEREFAALESQFGEIDRNAVALHAMRTKTDVTTAYKDLTFDNLYQQTQKQKADQAALAAKQAAQVVAGGANAGGPAATAAAAPPGKMSLADAWRASLKAHGAA